MGSVAINFVGGIPFQILYDGVKVAIQKTRKFRTHLINLEFTLDCLHTRTLEQIGENNVMLNLPNNIVEDLETKMNEGIELVAMLSKLSMWNVRIWGNCYNCIGPDCADQLGELDRSLRRLLELLELEQRRNVTELLCLARHAKDKQDDLEKKQGELAKKVDVILRGQQEIYATLMKQHDVIQRIAPNSEQQAPSSSEGGAAGPALGLVFQRLFDAVAQVPVKNLMFKRLLRTFKSTLYCIQPLIEEIAEHSRVLHLPNQEAEKLILQIGNGVEYVLKCSKVGKHANYKKYKHTSKILDLNESLQKLFIELKGQVEQNVKEAIESANKIEMAIRKIEAEDLCHIQLPEHPSPETGSDILNMQGLSDVFEETFLDSTGVGDEELQQTKDNSAVQSQMNIQGSSDMPPHLTHLKDLSHSSPPSVLDGNVDGTLYDHLDQAMAEAENAKREALEEAIRRGKAEKDAIDAIPRAKASEFLYNEELRQRKEIEDTVAIYDICGTPAEPIRYPDIPDMASFGEILVIQDMIYVALGTSVKESKLNLIWTLQNSGGKRVCIIHVHQPAQIIPMMETKFPASQMKDQELRAYREIERQNMQKILEDYLRICRQMGIRAEKLHIEMDCIEKGIVELISQHGIRKLVMGAAADKSHSRKMTDLKSKKAIYVREHAPVYCHIQFVCKGHLIHTREANLDAVDAQVALPSPRPSTDFEQSPLHLRSRSSVTFGQNNRPLLSNPAQDLFRRVRSAKVDKYGGSTTDVTEGISTPSSSRLEAERSADEWDRVSRRSTSGYSSSPSSALGDLSLIQFERTEGSENGSGSSSTLTHLKDLNHSSPPSVLDENADDTLYDHLDQATAEAENAKREAFEEAIRRGKAEKDAIDAIPRATAAEFLYNEELRQRKEIEDTVAREAHEKMKRQQDAVVEELRAALNQKSKLESQIAETDQMVQSLEQKIISAVDLLQSYKRERDELHVERDNALREAEELRRQQVEASSAHMPQFFSDFSFPEIEEATRNFDPSLKIGEGGYGSIFKGFLRHTEVAIKMLNAHSLQGPFEFQQEVDVLSKLRHTNLVTLIGACPEAWTLIYEYLPNGSLEDRLTCKDSTSPLSWQARIRIATELCSVLIFLHSSRPHSIVHGDLKPSNILLDAHFVCKLSDFGISRLLSRGQGSSNNTTLCCRTDPKDTFSYMDPEFLSSGELTPKSDVYSFGIILLRLLTGRPALGITKEVQYALDSGKLETLLDPLAGDWPFVQAEQLARLALRCCEMSRKCRADLVSDVWRVLEPMRASCGSSSSFRLGTEEHFQPPPYFICPIFQEVMQDPHVAADGFTYEAEALRGWLGSGHDTSPMTNLKLEHKNLVPNHVLRAAIQEWLQRQQRTALIYKRI